jgi:peptidoglycan hydrolase CwlO-like protein
LDKQLIPQINHAQRELTADYRHLEEKIKEVVAHESERNIALKHLTSNYNWIMTMLEDRGALYNDKLAEIIYERVRNEADKLGLWAS